MTNFHAVDGRKEFRFVVFGAPGSNHVASQLQRRTPKGTVFFQRRSPRASRLYTWYTPPCTKIRSGLDISSDSPLNLFKKAEKRAWNLFFGTFSPLYRSQEGNYLSKVTRSRSADLGGASNT